jgi:hypothetical protein
MAPVRQRGRLQAGVVLLAFALLLPLDVRTAQAPPSPPNVGPAAVAIAPPPPDADIEGFLLEGKVGDTHGTKKGITGARRASLSTATLTHDAQIQSIDEFKREFRTDRGVEFDFRDSWAFNVAAYKIDRMLGLNMVPVSVERKYRSTPSAFTWWIDDVLMDEGDRLKKKIEAPDRASWYRQTIMMRLFDQLIANVDRNMGNMIYTKDWRLWAIDHTRAFRKNSELKTPAHISRCDRKVFERLKALDLPTLKREVGRWLDDGQLKALLARRDEIVKKLEVLGPAALFDSPTPALTPPTTAPVPIGPGIRP